MSDRAVPNPLPPLAFQERRLSLGQRIWIHKRLYLYIFPTLALLITFSYWPAISALYHAFYNWDPFGPATLAGPDGLDNFRQLYRELFQPKPGLTKASWSAVQWAGWLAPALLVAFFMLMESVKDRAWGWLKILGYLVLGGAMVVIVARSVQLIGSAASALSAWLSLDGVLTLGAVVLLGLWIACLAGARFLQLPGLVVAALMFVGAVLTAHISLLIFIGVLVLFWVGRHLDGPRCLAVVAWVLLGAAAVLLLVTLKIGVGGVHNRSVMAHYAFGHLALLLLAAGQATCWVAYRRTGRRVFFRLLGLSTALVMFFGLGLLLRVSQGGDLRASCWNLARVMSFGLTIGLVMPLLIAEILFHLTSDRWKYIYRVLFIIPMVVPGIVATLMWQFIYDYNFGVLNKIVIGLKTPGVQMFLLTALYLVALYLLVLNRLGRARRGAPGGWVTIAILVCLVLPVAALAGHLVAAVVKGGGKGYSLFVLEGLGWLSRPAHNPGVQFGVLTALFLAALALVGLRLYLRRSRGAHLGATAYLLAPLMLIPMAVVAGYAIHVHSSAGAGAAAVSFPQFVDNGVGLGWLGSLELKPRDWLGSSDIALYSVMLMGFPWIGTISMLIFYAGLQAIPTSVLESARLDGATGLRRFFSIDFPLILGQFKLLLILGVIGGIQGFQTVLILTYGGPGKATEMPGLLMFKEAFNYARLGYGTTIGVVMFVVILALTYVNMKYIRPSAEAEQEANA